MVFDDKLHDFNNKLHDLDNKLHDKDDKLQGLVNILHDLYDKSMI